MLVIEPQSAVPVVRAFGIDGVQIASFPVIIPEAKSTGVAAAARGSSGLVAVIGGSFDSEGRHSNFVALFPPDGGMTKIVVLKNYVPMLVAVAPDGSVWTAGIPYGKNSHVFCHFAPTGQRIGSSVSHNSFPVQDDIIDPRNRMAASSDRIGWFSAKAGRYIELSASSGAVTADIPSSEFTRDKEKVLGFALTDDGRTFFDTVTTGGAPYIHNVYSLDAKTGILSPQAVPGFFYLMGGEGNRLIGELDNKIVSYDVVP